MSEVKSQLILATRPRSLDLLLGQQKVVKAIRDHHASGRVVKNWLFAGPKGTGKTSCARVLALAYQCEHQEAYGVPCLACRTGEKKFDIAEVNAAQVTGKDAFEDLLQGAFYDPGPFSKYRIYILDEVQKASKSAQDLLLKYLEDTPSTTIFILCTTAPWDLSDTLQSRCLQYKFRELDGDEMAVLVRRVLKKIKVKLPVDRLVEELLKNEIRSPRFIVQAVEKYAAGQSPVDAADVESSSTVDIKALTKAVTKGDWAYVSDTLSKVESTDVRAIRVSMISYLRTVLLGEKEFNERADIIAQAIMLLSDLRNTEDKVVGGMVASVLYRLSAMFSQYKI